jgi:hypothetical protein
VLVFGGRTPPPRPPPPPGLNVYADNHVARRLYESMGYVETARQLHKELGDEDPLVS